MTPLGGTLATNMMLVILNVNKKRLSKPPPYGPTGRSALPGTAPRNTHFHQ